MALRTSCASKPPVTRMYLFMSAVAWHLPKGWVVMSTESHSMIYHCTQKTWQPLVQVKHISHINQEEVPRHRLRNALRIFERPCEPHKEWFASCAVVYRGIHMFPSYTIYTLHLHVYGMTRAPFLYEWCLLAEFSCVIGWCGFPPSWKHILQSFHRYPNSRSTRVCTWCWSTDITQHMNTQIRKHSWGGLALK